MSLFFFLFSSRMAVGSPTEFLCEICLTNYDTLGRKPYSLVPCGHTFCLSCMNQITSNLCPTCRSPFTGRIPNWEITRRLEPPSGQQRQANAPPVQEAPLMQNVETAREPTCMEDFLATSTKRKCKLNYN